MGIEKRARLFVVFKEDVGIITVVFQVVPVEGPVEAPRVAEMQCITTRPGHRMNSRLARQR